MESSLTVYGKSGFAWSRGNRTSAWRFRVTGDFRAIGLLVIPVTPSAADVS